MGAGPAACPGWLPRKARWVRDGWPSTPAATISSPGEEPDMTAFDDLTDSSPESPAEALAEQPGGLAETPAAMGGSDESQERLDPSGDPGGAGDLGGADDETVAGPGVDSSDQERGNLDGSTA